DEALAIAMKDEISRFYDFNMKDLMYRDWSGFELFFIEILKCASLPALAQISHRFETFLMTLFREVQKRSILQNTPTPEDLLESPIPPEVARGLLGGRRREGAQGSSGRS